MAKCVFLLFAFFFFVCIADVSVVHGGMEDVGELMVKGGSRRLMSYVDCSGLCGQRCSLHSRPNLCKRACGTCCMGCKCVPPGTSGNREVCGTCYTEMTTHGNRSKCP